MTKRNVILVGFLTLAIASRFLILLSPAWANFSPLAPMALFAGAYFMNRNQAVLSTLFAVWISNVLLNNLVYPSYFQGFSWGFDAVHMGTFALITVLGSKMRMTTTSFVGTNMAAVLGFFVISNVAVWAGNDVAYTRDLSGLATCLAAGIPFLKNAIASQFLFAIALFGGFEIIKQKALQPEQR